MVVTKPPGEEGGKPRKRGGSGREEERRSAAGRGEGEGAAGPTRKRHRRPGRRDEDEASRTEQQSATRQASAIPGEHERVVASRADEGRVPSFRERGKKKARGAREGRKGARKVGGGGVEPGSSSAGRFSKEGRTRRTRGSNRLAGCRWKGRWWCLCNPGCGEIPR